MGRLPEFYVFFGLHHVSSVPVLRLAFCYLHDDQPGAFCRYTHLLEEGARFYHFTLHLDILHKLHLARDPHHVSAFAFGVEEADFYFGVDFKLLVDIFVGVDAVVEAGFVGGEKLQRTHFRLVAV